MARARREGRARLTWPPPSRSHRAVRRWSRATGWRAPRQRRAQSGLGDIRSPGGIPHGSGLLLLYPENHAAICGTARVAVDLCQVAEAAGYSRDLCSYVRTDLGSLYSGKTPVGRLPRPDLLVACTNICQTVLFWYRVLAEHFQVPLVIVDTPFVYGEDAPPHALQYVGTQIDEAIAVAEQVAGRALNDRSFEAVAVRSRRATELWLEIMQRNRHVPAPISVFDQFVLMAPIVELRGQASTVDFYGAMLAEVDARIRAGVAAVPGERYRVLWDNLPIWYRLRAVAELLAERGIAVVASTYTNAWGELAPYLDPAAPRELMIRAYTYPILNRGSGHKLRTMQRMIEDYSLDGVILHSDRSCKPYSLGQMDQRDRLAGELAARRCCSRPITMIPDATPTSRRPIAWRPLAKCWRRGDERSMRAGNRRRIGDGKDGGRGFKPGV